MSAAPSAVAVVVEHLRGEITAPAYEALAAARRVADGGEVVALLCGAARAGLAASLGAADRVLSLADPDLDDYSPDAYEGALASVLGDLGPRLVVVPNTTVGMDLGAGLAARLGLPLAAYCVDLRRDGEAIVAKSQVYGGKILVELALSGPGVVTLVPGSFSADEGRREGSPAVERVTGVAPASPRIRAVAYRSAEAADVDITREAVLVSVGRGIGGPENVPLAEELARALGGVVSASRPVTDAGWLPRTRQVGKSGLTVKPKLYLALGISGAPEHLQGMKDAELIVAVNTDPHAPIFSVADYGIVGDVLEVVPEITKQLQEAP